MADENNAGNSNKPDSKEKPEAFTLDGDSDNMPSVTRLLNRKSLNLTSTPKHETPPAPAAEEIAPPEPVVDPSPISPPRAAVVLKVKPIVKKTAHPVAPLIIWDKAKIKMGPDPLGKGIAQLIDKGASCAVFLTIAPPSPGSKVPQFIGTAAVLPDKRLSIWTGLHWDPNKSPEAWNFLVKSGSIEFPPPGTQTQLDSHRNVIRAAFGVESEEWLLLTRVGTPNACRGIVVILSKKSLLLEVKSVLSLLQEAPKK
jgi:hypothetical protein